MEPERESEAPGTFGPGGDTSWLDKHSAREWIQIALAEVQRAASAFEANDMAGGLASARRAAGMALNGALVVRPNAGWGRSYVDHIRALEGDLGAPPAVREACRQLLEARPPNAHLLTLRVPRQNERIVEAARDVMAHALAIVMRHEAP